MESGEVCYPESPGFHPGLFVRGSGGSAWALPRSPGRKPGDSGREGRPVINAQTPRALAAQRPHAWYAGSRFDPVSPGFRRGLFVMRLRMTPKPCGRAGPQNRAAAHDPKTAWLRGPQEAPGGNPGTPGMCAAPRSISRHRPTKWAKARDGFAHVKASQEATLVGRGKPWLSTGRPSGQRPGMALPT